MASPRKGDASKVNSPWARSRTGERAAALAAVANDPKFKKYSQQVEKCLTTFDNIQEWADFISFLTKLLKTFQSYMQFKEIPRKLIVAKRLSQCLNPALPTGVHQRALDVYAHILAVLGSEGLKRDLQLWSSGLFPFFEYAATAVKPTLLNLYDTHYLPLQQGLRPIMKSFILALLPGLEEETGEFFDKVLALLDRLSGTVSPSFFLQNIWLVMLTTPSVRGPALNYLSRRLPKLHGDEDITPIVGRDVGLMIRAFSAALEDDNLLVRRSILDLLLQSLRMDSPALKRAAAEDRALLMKAASSVVLRRDSSLNRRLYNWLLGPEEQSETQLKYLRENALELLRSTLREEMFSVTDFPDARPYKIFLSLLDKWEIGTPLTEVLILDTLKAIKQSVREEDEGGDVLIAASALYEAVEPHAIWKNLFSSVRSELVTDAKTFEGIKLVRFILATFPTHDEEVQNIHLPVFVSALAELINYLCNSPPSKISASASTHEILELLNQIITDIPPSAFGRSPGSLPGSKDGGQYTGPYHRACNHFALSDLHKAPIPVPSQPRSEILFVTVFEDIASFCHHCARALVRGEGSEGNQKSFSLALSLLLSMISRLEEKQKSPLTINWNPRAWLEVALQVFGHVSSFALVDKIIRFGIRLNNATIFSPRVSIDDLSTMSSMITTLLAYLRPHFAPYHVRAVGLIWDLESSTSRHYVESVVARSLTNPSEGTLADAYDAFGVLWRLSEDVQMPGIRFKVPLLIVLDALKSDEPNMRRIGETWMRCSLKSYIRVLDPILFDLLDPSIRQSPASFSFQGRDIQGYTYETPFDQHRILYLCELLLSLVRFGGQGFGKAARGMAVQRSHYQKLAARVNAVKLAHPDASYMDVLLEVLLRFLQSEPKRALSPTMDPVNGAIQATVIDLIQSVVGRGELDAASLENTEAAVIGKLYASVHTDRFDLQNKLLHLLHSVIFASSSTGDTRHSKIPRAHRPSDIGGSTEDLATRDDIRPVSHTTSVNPLLVQTLIDGISKTSHRPVLQHWLDFVLMTIPQFQHSLYPLVFPLSDCICRQLRSALLDLERVRAQPTTKADIRSFITDSEVIVLLNAIERLVLLSLSKGVTDSSTGEEEVNISDRTAPESTGLLNYVSTVFSSDTASVTTEDHLSARSPSYSCLHEAVRVLHALWISSEWKPSNQEGAENDSLSLVYSRTRTRTRKVLERLFRAQSGEVMESIIECWHRESSNGERPSSTFEIIDLLASSAQAVVHMLCESIMSRTPVYSDKTRKIALNPNITDAILFNFLEEYLGRLEGPIATQVWGRFLALAKEVLANAPGFKLQLFPVLRCMNVLSETISQTTAMEDRRLRRDLQDTFSKLTDNCILIAGRTFEQGNWIRLGAVKDPLATNGRASPLPRGQSDPALDDKTATPADEVLKPAWGVELIDQINEFIAKKVLPNLRRFLMDSEKILTICSKVVSQIVTPAMKGKSSRTLEVEDVVMDMLKEMARIPAAAKAWRSPVNEAFNDNRFFNGSVESSKKWRPLVRALMDSDKQAFGELIGKVATAPSANIFTNREYEMLLRSLNLRRLSFVVFTGDENHFLAQLPTIQEKLVDILRNTTAPVVQSEVYLCMRVLLCRLSPHNLSSFWPVILTEMFRLFEQAMVEPPPDNSEDLQLILSACKFLDLLLVLQTEEFQIHQWMFVTDTVDAVYHPENWTPESLMDQLAEIVSDLPDSRKQPSDGKHNGTEPSYIPRIDSAFTPRGPRNLRKPLLSSLRQIESIKDLIPFFSHVSIATYESIYAVGSVDWDTVERGLLEEMFEES